MRKNTITKVNLTYDSKRGGISDRPGRQLHRGPRLECLT
jgi:hypothetical protein